MHDVSFMFLLSLFAMSNEIIVSSDC